MFSRLFAALLFNLLFCTGVYAQSLEGRVLPASDSTDDVVSNALTELIMGDGGAEGNVSKVTVIKETERSLKVDIEFTGFRQRDLSVRVANSDREPIRDIEAFTQRIADGETKIQAELTLQDGLDEGFETLSPFLLIEVKRPNGGMTVRERYFALNKTWSVAIAPENLLVSVKPAPVGASIDFVRKIKQPPQGEKVLVPRTVIQQPGSVITKDIGKTVMVTPAASQSNLRTQMTPQRLQLNPELTRKLLQGSAATQSERTLETSTPSTQSSDDTPKLMMDMSAIRLNDVQRMEMMRDVTASRDVVAVTDLPSFYTAIDPSVFEYQRAQPPQPPTSTEPTNTVSNIELPVFDLVATEPGIDVSLSSVLGIHRQVLPDANANSGIYYYIPDRYQLDYDRDVGGADGLAFRISYATLSEGADTSSAIRMAMTMTSPLDGNGIAIARALLEKYAASRSDVKFSELRRLPLADMPQFNFTDSLQGDVDDANIRVVGFSDFLEGLTVTWIMDEISAQNVRQQLSDIVQTVSGQAFFPLPSSGEPIAMAVPAEISLADPEVYRAITFERGTNLRNNSPLPVRLKYIHALVLAADGGPRIYSWSLNNESVPAQAQVAFDLADLPAAIDDAADRIWIEYGLDSSCSNCVTDILNTVLRSSVWPDTSSLTVAPLPSLFRDGVAEVTMQLRSRFLDPNDRTLQSAPPLFLRDGGGSQEVKPLFVSDATDPDTGETWPLYEYKLSVALETGEIIEGQNWIASTPVTSERLTPGSFQLEQSLGRPIIAEPEE